MAMDAAQYGGMIAAITGGLGAIAIAIRWGLGRIAKAFDDMAAAFGEMGKKHELEERALVKLESVVAEGRADTAQALAATRETRDVVIERVGQRRTGQRPATSG